MKLTNILEQKGKKYRDAIDRAKRVYLQDDRPWIIGYSGGKDSTATCTVVLTALSELAPEKLKKHVYIISSDTLVETPLIINEINSTLYKMEQYGKKNNLPLSTHKVQPQYDNTFWANLIGKGYPCPNQTFRWCTDRMKIEPANRFIRDIVAANGEAIMVLGVRKGESNSRDRVLNSHSVKSSDLMRHTTLSNAFTFAPIIDFNIDDVWDVLLNYPCPWGGNNQELFKLYGIWDCRDSAASLAANAKPILPEIPVSISSNTKVFCGSGLATVLTANMRRLISPPEIICANGRTGSPTFAENKNSTASAPLFLGTTAVNCTSNCVCSMPKSFNCAVNWVASSLAAA